MFRRSILLLSLAVASTGCATIMKGTTQNVNVSSSPVGATVTIQSSTGVEVFQGATPASTRLPKKREYAVTVSAPGYEEVRVPITQSLEGWYIGNLLCGGIVGGIVDAVNGAMWHLEPESISVSLRAAGGGRITTLDATPAATEPFATPSIADVSVPSSEPRVYAVFHARDAAGQLRSLAVPMVRKVATAAN